jgi:hypothetical protein
LEETGIRAHFRGILAFTYEADFRFGHGDVYFCCLMSLNENDDDEGPQQIRFDPLEISVCRWMSLDEWARSPEHHPIPITWHLARLAVDVLDGREQLLESDRIEVVSKIPHVPSWNVMMYRKKSTDRK